MKTENKAMLAAFIAYAIFGMSFLFSKIALQHAEPFILLITRFSVTFLVLNLMLLLKAGQLNLNGKKLGPVILLGLLQPLLYYVLENYGLKYTTTSFTGVASSISPVLTIILGAVMLRERPNLKQWLSVVASIVGVTALSLMSGSSGSGTLAGCLCLLGAYTSGSLYSILSRQNSRYFTPFEMTYIMFAVGFVGFAALSLFQYGGKALVLARSALVIPEFLLSILYLGILSSVVAFLLINYSLAHLPVALASIFGNVSAVVSLLAGVIVMNDPFSPLQCICVVVILLGVWGVNRFRFRSA